MDTIQAIDNLKQYIEAIYNRTGEKIGANIYRGHLRSISTDIEDGIAIFVAGILPDSYKILIDASIHVDGKNNRPDLLIVDGENRVKALVEIKANMGWCRNASRVIDHIISNDAKFIKQKNLSCEFSKDDELDITYHEGVKRFLIALTNENCTAKDHQANQAYASANGVSYYCLFSGWYNSLSNFEIAEFAEKLLDLSKTD